MPGAAIEATRPEENEPASVGAADGRPDDHSPHHTSREADEPERTRIDRWLSAARLFKSRSQAHKACEAGHVSVNGVAVKASRTIQIGDRVSAIAPRGLVVAVVRAIEEKRQGADRARALYDDQSPPPVARDSSVGMRPRGMGRPTKAERRAIMRLTDPDAQD
jgi:ribosome-associated heat shock protein Hsp15